MNKMFCAALVLLLGSGALASEYPDTMCLEKAQKEFIASNPHLEVDSFDISSVDEAAHIVAESNNVLDENEVEEVSQYIIDFTGDIFGAYVGNNGGSAFQLVFVNPTSCSIVRTVTVYTE